VERNLLKQKIFNCFWKKQKKKWKTEKYFL